MAKDRARPFSRKHRKYWMPVLGGMILIGFLNVGIGWCSYSQAPETHERIQIAPDEDPAAKMAHDAAKRALEKREAAKRQGSGSDAAALPRAPQSVPR